MTEKTKKKKKAKVSISENNSVDSKAKEKKKVKNGSTDSSKKNKEEKKDANDMNGLKEEKNVDDKNELKEEKEIRYLTGQRHDRLHERDPLRIFFETLYQKSPESELVANWMLEWGLLPEEEAEKIYRRQRMEKTSHILDTKSDELSSNCIKKTKKRNTCENSSDVDSIKKKKHKKFPTKQGFGFNL